MGGGSVVWAETPDDDASEEEDAQAHGAVDESFAARRLRRWIKGMFGGEQEPSERPPDTEPDS
jgi:hypothetical protein